MTITRRVFLASAATAMMSQRVFAAPLPREADIVVIGAGAAGIAAARRIMAANRKVVVIEATGAVGGRCQTDAATFEAPFDRGARWIYNADSNPLVRLGRGAGLEIAAVPLGQKLRIGRRNARAGETEDLLATLVRANRAIDEAARGRVDVNCAAALPKDLGEWGGTIDFALGASATGKDLKDLSALDKSRAEDHIAVLACREGLGVLMAKLGEGVPLALATPANRIAWSNRDVAVETPAGKITARAAIVTVSSNVLTAGALKFAPDLPKRSLDAAAKLTLGSIDRIALQLSGNPLGLGRDDIVIEQSRDIRTGLLLANVRGTSLCVVDVAGSFGRDLSAQGEAAMIAFATEWLGKLFGSDVVKTVGASAATRWNAAPFALGAMSGAVPGGQGARRVLAEPVGNLFFAGEATHETLWGTVDGAWQSGERAAEAALRRIGALREAEPVSSVPERKPPPRKQRQRQAPAAPLVRPGGDGSG